MIYVNDLIILIKIKTVWGDILIYIFFLIAITLHNIEEAIWLPQWSQTATKFYKPIEKKVFNFAIIVITLLVYVSLFLYLAFSSIFIYKFIFIGFLGSMIINTFFPHLFFTIVLKKYCPGTLSGFLLIIPSHLIILSILLRNNITNILEILVATLVVGIALLILIPILFKIARRFTKKKIL